MIISLVVLTLAVNALTRYDIETKTAREKHADTDDIKVHLTLHGSNGKFNFGELDNPTRNDFEKGRTDRFSNWGEDIGDTKCVELNVFRDDAWLFDWISVKSTDHEIRVFQNTASVWLSSDKGEGEKSLKLCTEDSTTEYSIDVRTATNKHADTDSIKLFLTLHGSDGDVDLGELDNPDHDDFERGKIDTFHKFGFKNVGAIECITLKVYRDDAWLFDWIEITSDGSSRKFNNRRNTWLSSDTSEGWRQLKVCD